MPNPKLKQQAQAQEEHAQMCLEASAELVRKIKRHQGKPDELLARAHALEVVWRTQSAIFDRISDRPLL